MIITNLRENETHTSYTADIGDRSGKIMFTLDYSCDPFEHIARLISKNNEVVSYKYIDCPDPLSWPDVRSWAISAVHSAKN